MNMIGVTQAVQNAFFATIFIKNIQAELPKDEDAAFYDAMVKGFLFALILPLFLSVKPIVKKFLRMNHIKKHATAIGLSTSIFHEVLFIVALSNQGINLRPSQNTGAAQVLTRRIFLSKLLVSSTQHLLPTQKVLPVKEFANFTSGIAAFLFLTFFNLDQSSEDRTEYGQPWMELCIGGFIAAALFDMIHSILGFFARSHQPSDRTERTNADLASKHFLSKFDRVNQMAELSLFACIAGINPTNPDFQFERASLYQRLSDALLISYALGIFSQFISLFFSAFKNPNALKKLTVSKLLLDALSLIWVFNQSLNFTDPTALIAFQELEMIRVIRWFLETSKTLTARNCLLILSYFTLNLPFFEDDKRTLSVHLPHDELSPVGAAVFSAGATITAISMLPSFCFHRPSGQQENSVSGTDSTVQLPNFSNTREEGRPLLQDQVGSNP